MNKEVSEYPKIKIKKDHLLMVVMFTEPNKGVIVDNIKGNIKGYESDWDEDDFIEIETILLNRDVSSAIYENILNQPEKK